MKRSKECDCERQAASEKEEGHDVKTICTCTPTFIDTDGCPTHGHVSEEKFERVCDICGQAYIGTRHECQPVAIVPSDPDDPRFDGVVVEREASGGALREELKQVIGSRLGEKEEGYEMKNQCTVILTKEGDRCPLEAGHAEPHQLDLTLPPKRRLAMAITSELLALDFIREQDVSGVIFAIEKELER